MSDDPAQTAAALSREIIDLLSGHTIQVVGIALGGAVANTALNAQDDPRHALNVLFGIAGHMLDKHLEKN